MFVASVAAAQDTTTTTVNTGEFPVRAESGRDFKTTPIGASECGSSEGLRILWGSLLATQLPSANAKLKIFVRTDTECKTAPAGAALLLDEDLTMRSSGAFPDPADATKLSIRMVLDAGNACTSEVEGTYAVCVLIDNQQSTPPERFVAYLPIDVDTKPPAAATGLSASGADGAVVVSWASDDDDLLEFRVHAVSTDGMVLDSVVDGGARTARVQGATNGVEYSITVTAVDRAGNIGPQSEAVKAVTRNECDFWECYSGKERGGFCFIGTAAYGSYDASVVQVFRDFRDRVLMKFSLGRTFVLWYYRHGAAPAVWLARHGSARQAAAGLLVVPYLAVLPIVRAGPGLIGIIAVLGALAVLLLVRHRRRAVATLTLLVALSAARSGAAQEPGFEDRAPYEAPIAKAQEKARPRYGFGVRLSPYRPNLDIDPAAGGIYGIYFGASPSVGIGAGRKLRVDFDAELYLLRMFGLLGLGASGGYWQATGRTRLCGGGACKPGDDLRASTPGTDSTTLTMFPLALSLVYKLDYFMERWRVPLVPFVRLGFDCYLWRVDGSGRQARKNPTTPKQFGEGATFGMHVHPGLALSLDWIEPETARRAYDSVGIHGTFVTVEWLFNKIDDFGSARSWDLSDTTLQVGLALNF